MNPFLSFFKDMNIRLWILGLFLFHGALYLALGTVHWFTATLLAAGTWSVALLILRAISKAMLKGEDPT